MNNDSNNNIHDRSILDLTIGADRATVGTGSPPPTDQQPLIPMERLVEDTMSEETLVAMGIDINEIRAQREIERRLEEEARQQEFAERLQATFNEELSAYTQLQANAPAESSTAPIPTPNSLPITESSRVASVTPTTNVNQPERPVTATTTTTSSSSSNAIITSNTNSNDDARTSLSVIRPPTPLAVNSRKRAAPSPAKRKPRRARRYWLLPGESFHESDSDEEISSESDEEMAIITGESNSNNNNDTTVNASINRSNTNNPINVGSSINSNSSNIHRAIPTTSGANSRKAKGKSKLDVSIDEIDNWMDIVHDDKDATPEIPTGALDDLNITLMEHQQTGFKWMYQQEKSDNKGGLLCDDMGLGKTIQSLAVIVSRRCPNPDPIPENSANMQFDKLKIKSTLVKSTLVVCPVDLMAQWAQEITNKTNNVSVYIHHGPKRLTDPYKVASFDVVVTSYTTLAAEFKNSNCRRSWPTRYEYGFDGVFDLIFHRIILDEAHVIKKASCKQSRACFTLKSTHKWCLTATPIQSRMDDMHSLIRFLGIKPYDSFASFTMEIALPLANADGSEKDKARKRFATFALRRSKKTKIGDRPILMLPERNVHVTYVDFTPEEQQIYDSVNTKVLSEFKSHIASNSVMRRYSGMLVLLLRLRQTCLHPSLSEFQQPTTATTESTQMQIARSLGKKVVARLLAIKNEIVIAECPICMDIADQPRIISACGHILCEDCLKTYVNSTNHFYSDGKPCPECRGVLRPNSVVPVDIFLKVHDPDTTPEGEGTSNQANLTNLSNTVGSSKINTMLDILEKTRQNSGGTDKTIIFSQFSPMINAIQKSLKSMNIKHERYDGTTVVAKRGKVISTFETDPSIQVLLVSTKTGAFGLNMTMAKNVIIMDVGWNPSIENQAIDRVHRIGQTKNVEVYRLVVRNTVEERLMELQTKKQDMVDNALDGGTKSGNDSFSKLGLNELNYLFCNIPLPDPVIPGPSS